MFTPLCSYHESYRNAQEYATIGTTHSKQVQQTLNGSFGQAQSVDSVERAHGKSVVELSAKDGGRNRESQDCLVSTWQRYRLGLLAYRSKYSFVFLLPVIGCVDRPVDEQRVSENYTGVRLHLPLHWRRRDLRVGGAMGPCRLSRVYDLFRR